MVDTLHLITNETILLDASFRRSNKQRNFSSKLGFNFKILWNGKTLINGSLSEFHNKINEISNTNYPLLPINNLDLTVNAFSDIFNLKSGYIDINRLDLAIDCNIDTFINLQNIVEPTGKYKIGLVNQETNSIYFKDPKSKITILFYQNNHQPGRPPGIRYETRLIKDIPIKILPELSQKKINGIIPFLENRLEAFVYKTDSSIIQNIVSTKHTYKQLKEIFFQYGLLITDNLAFSDLINMLKNTSTDRHIINRLNKERIDFIKKNQNNLQINPLNLLRNSLKNL